MARQSVGWVLDRAMMVWKTAWGSLMGSGAGIGLGIVHTIAGARCERQFEHYLLGHHSELIVDIPLGFHTGKGLRKEARAGVNEARRTSRTEMAR